MKTFSFSLQGFPLQGRMSVRDFFPIGRSDDMTRDSSLLTGMLWGHCRGTMCQLPARDERKAVVNTGDRPDSAHLSVCSSPALSFTHCGTWPKVRLTASVCWGLIKDKTLCRSAVTLGKWLFSGFVIGAVGNWL